MRVSTSMIFNSGSSGIQNRQSDLFKVQNQMSTGRRILSPEDDPIGAAEVLKVSQSKSVNKQFLDNQGNAQVQLTFLESTLGSVSDELVRVIELAKQAESPSYSASQRGMIATELKGRMENLIGLANTQDGTGLYIFAGYQSATKPFEEITESSPPVIYKLSEVNGETYVKYNGDAGKSTLQVTASKDMAVSENGLDVFMQVKNSLGVVTGRTLFDSLQNLVNNLDGSLPYDPAVQAQAFADLNSGLGHISNVRASVGARQNSLDNLTSAGQDSAYLYDARLSDLQDLDYAAAISDFSRFQMQLEAAQLSFKQSSQLSLFNIL